MLGKDNNGIKKKTSRDKIQLRNFSKIKDFKIC